MGEGRGGDGEVLCMDGLMAEKLERWIGSGADWPPELSVV